MLWIIISIAILLVLISIHELGHFLSGELLGFSILEFSIGFGPAIFSKKGKDGVKYSIRLLPLGGYCSFYNEPEPYTKFEEIPETINIAFNDQKPWKRLIVMISGILMNFALALALCFAMFISFGSSEVIVSEVTDDTPAAVMGLIQGDIIEKIDSKEIDMYNISSIIQESGKSKAEVSVDRDGEQVILKSESLYNAVYDNYSLGIIASQGEKVSLSIGKIVKYSFETLGESSGAILSAFKGLVTKPSESLENMSGPIGTVTEISGLLKEGYKDGGKIGDVMRMVLSISILISTNLAIFNLMPIPGLDGGSIVLTFFEMITKKPIPEKARQFITLIGFGLIFLLFILTTSKDVGSLFGS